jgi:palmitoyl-protein thioesterase
MYWDNDSWI